jgi:hypothetical protein
MELYKMKTLKTLGIGLLALLLLGRVAYAVSPYYPIQGGTGTSTIPTLGYVLVGQSNGTYGPQATSTLGFTGGSSNNYFATTSINGFATTTFIFATSTAQGIGLNISTSSSQVLFVPTVLSGYTIPLTASTTAWTTTPSTLLIGSGFLYTATSTDYIQADHFVATSTTSTSTFANAVSVGTTTALNRFSLQAIAASTVPFGIYNASGSLAASISIASGQGSSLNMYQSGTQAVQVTPVTGSANYFNNSGNFGIGTTTPGSLLTVMGTSSTYGIVSAIRSASIPLQSLTLNGGDASAMYLTAQSPTAAPKPFVINNTVSGGASTTATNIQFQIQGATAMTLGSTGFLGIGSTTPNFPLSVTGSGYFTGTITDTGITNNGAITSTGVDTAPSFVANNSSVTSTFAGSVAIGGAGITASNNSVAMGYASGASSSVTSSAQGAFANGYALNVGAKGVITSSGNGSFATGQALGIGVPAAITASGGGSFAGGSDDGAEPVLASAEGAFAFGQNVSAVTSFSTAFGKGFSNNIANSFMVGYSGTPSFTVNGSNVGIGTTNPGVLLQVGVSGNSIPNSNVIAKIANNSNGADLEINGNGYARLFFDDYSQTTNQKYYEMLNYQGNLLFSRLNDANTLRTNIMTLNTSGLTLGGGTPTMGTCGTSPSVSGNDNVGKVTVGTGVVTSCTVNFGTTKTGTPHVFITVDGATAIANSISSVSTSGFTANFAASLGAGTFDYFIVQN